MRGSRVSGFEFRVLGFRFGVHQTRFWLQFSCLGFAVRVLGYTIEWASMVGVPSAPKEWVSDFEIRDSGLGFRVPVSRPAFRAPNFAFSDSGLE